MDQFSGGERDVIALCARLALSRLIGGQAAHPPGFLRARRSLRLA